MGINTKTDTFRKVSKLFRLDNNKIIYVHTGISDRTMPDLPITTTDIKRIGIKINRKIVLSLPLSNRYNAIIMAAGTEIDKPAPPEDARPLRRYPFS